MALDHPIDKPAPRTLPPAAIDVMASARARPLRQVGSALMMATVVTALLGSEALLNWANELPISPTSDTILAAAQTWHDGLQRTGLPSVATELRAAFRRFQSWGK